MGGRPDWRKKFLAWAPVTIPLGAGIRDRNCSSCRSRSAGAMTQGSMTLRSQVHLLKEKLGNKYTQIFKLSNFVLWRNSNLITWKPILKNLVISRFNFTLFSCSVKKMNGPMKTQKWDPVTSISESEKCSCAERSVSGDCYRSVWATELYSSYASVSNTIFGSFK